MSERAEITTKDDIKIIGDFYSAGENTPYAAILLHMMPADRKSWAPFAEKLQKSGISSLAIDLRGHGESISAIDGKIIDYKDFSDEDHQKSIEDVRAAHKWLKEKGAEYLFIAGASIGANLALRHASENSDIVSVILLSPGINYRGVEALSFANHLDSNKDVYVIAARDDKNVPEADKMAKEIHNAIISKKKDLKIFESGGHGTDILLAHTDFEDTLVEFFKKLLS